jgi:hypothetical protein
LNINQFVSKKEKKMRQQSGGGCLTAFAVGFSRMFLIFAWLARPIAFERVFGGSWILPCIGIMILPFTTLMYVILSTSGPGLTGSIQGLDWLWLALAVAVDVAGAGAAAAANRDRVPQGYPGALPPSNPQP